MTPSIPHPLWIDLTQRAGVSLREAQYRQFDRYLSLLLEANRHLNLTRIDDPESAAVLHVADALTLLAHLPPGRHKLGDVGSGGGVPGVILAVARPDVDVTLFESVRKKAVFLEETAADLELANVQVAHQRAEQSHMKGRFEVVTARAVAPLDQLVQWCLPLLNSRGKLLLMKGKKVTEELPAAQKILAARRSGAPIIHPAPLPGADHHVIVEIPGRAG